MAITLDGTTGITNDGGYTGDGINFADTTPANTLITTTGGNVGIGTASPAQKLDVIGNVRVGGTTGQFFINASSTSQYPALFFQSAGTSRASIFMDDSGATYPVYVSVNTAAPLIFRTDATERMRIDSSGNVTPGANGTQNLGSTSLRWANVYTSDLHLNNGIGNYTIVEGEEDLFLYNNKSGKTYKFALIEVDPSTAPAKMKE